MNTKQYILSKCNNFSTEQNLIILQCIKNLNIRTHEAPDGTRINLDILSQKDLAEIESKVKEIDKPISKAYQIE